MKRELSIIFIIVLVSFIGIALPYPIFSPLFLEGVHTGTLTLSIWQQNHITLLLGIVLGAYPIGQFLGSPIMGSLSDEFGRKKILCLSLLGAIFGYIFTGFAVQTDHIGLLIFGRFLTGLLESNMSIARAMITDMPEINKHQGFGLIAAAATIGFILGPVLGGLLSSHQWLPIFSFQLPFYFAALLSLLACLLSYCFLRADKKNSAITKKSLLDFFKLFFIYFQKNHVALRHALFIAISINLAADIFYQFYSIFVVQQIHASTLLLSTYVLAVGIGVSIGDGWLVAKLSNTTHNHRVLSTSLSLFFVGLVAFLILPISFVAYLLLIFIGITAAIATTFASVEVSDQTPPNKQGEVMGLLWGIRMLGCGLAAMIGGGLLIFSNYLPLTIALMILLLTYYISRYARR